MRHAVVVGTLSALLAGTPALRRRGPRLVTFVLVAFGRDRWVSVLVKEFALLTILAGALGVEDAWDARGVLCLTTAFVTFSRTSAAF